MRRWFLPGGTETKRLYGSRIFHSLSGICFSRNKPVYWLTDYSDDIVQRIGVTSPQLAHSFAELGDSYALEDLNNRIAHFFHDAPNAASFLVGTGTALIEFFADTTDWGQGAFNETNHSRERDLFRRQFETVTTRDAAAALENAGGPEIVQNLLEKPFWNVLFFRNRLDSDNIVFGPEPQHDQCS